MRNVFMFALSVFLILNSNAQEIVATNPCGFLVIDGVKHRFEVPAIGETARVYVKGRGIYVIDHYGSVVTNIPPVKTKINPSEWQSRQIEKRKLKLFKRRHKKVL